MSELDTPHAKVERKLGVNSEPRVLIERLSSSCLSALTKSRSSEKVIRRVSFSPITTVREMSSSVSVEEAGT
jgi:hypothetical protein